MASADGSASAAASSKARHDGDAKLSGSGNAAEEGSCDAEHREDTLEGTAAYLAPEVVKGEATSVASDCWALGCVVYQCLAGRPPVWADSQSEIMDKIVSFRCETSFPPEFPDAAKDLVMKLMDPNPKTRLGAGVDGLAAVTVRVRPVVMWLWGYLCVWNHPSLFVACLYALV